MLASILPYAPAAAQAHSMGPMIGDKWIDFQGQTFLRHVFHPNGTVVVSDGIGASLVIGGLELPFTHRTELLDYCNGTVAYRLSFMCLGMMYEVWEAFDFNSRPSEVKITIRGAMPMSGQIAIPLRAGAGSVAKHDDASKIFRCVRSGDTGNQSSGVGFDWSDMGPMTAFSSSTSKITANVSRSFLIDPSTVGTTSYIYSTLRPFQRKSFYANGRYWVFYVEGSNIVFRTSTDGSSWSASTTVRSNADPDSQYCVGGHFSVFFDGTYLHYAYADDASSGSLYYRRGIPNSDGSMTWSAVEQTAYSQSGYNPSDPFVSVDSSGYPWIGFSCYSSGHRAYVTKSSKNDGTWTTESGFPYQLTNSLNDYNRVTIVPLTSQKVYAIYTASGGCRVYGKLWTGSWGNEEQVSTGASTIQSGSYYSAVASSDDIHFVYLSSSTVKYIKRIYGTGWQSEVTVQSSVTTTSAPVLSINTATADLCCFWGGSPTADHIYYKKCVGGTWDTDPTDWIDESTDHLTANDRLTSFYKDYGGKIGLVYMTKTSADYNTRYQTMTMGISTVNTATYQPFQRKCFYANGRFWVFYSDGTNMVFITGTNGIAWSFPTSVRSCDNGEKFSIWFDGNYVHYACCAESDNAAIYYRRGTPNSDGTITWSTQQTAVAGVSGTTYSLPCIAVDSNSYPWIGYRKVTGTTPKRPMVTKSTKTDGTWTTDTGNGFPYDLAGYDLSAWFVVPVPLTGGKVTCLFSSNGNYVRARSWSGSAWGTDKTTASVVTTYYLSAVAQGDSVHVVFLTDGGYAIIKYAKYTYDPTNPSWGTEVNVQGAPGNYVTSTSAPVLSINTANNDLYCFWASHPTTDHIYYKKCVSGTWDTNPTDWITETTDHLTANDLLTCFYKDYGNYIGLVYMTATSANYNIRFNYGPA